MNAPTSPQKLTVKDFATDQDVRWCPGCGDYAILKAVQKTLADLGADKDKTVFVSGIGCSSRFPYYMETYGFHTIHGRAPAIATGVKLANPELDVWIVTGDGDGLSIGGNHLMHAIRRNIDCQILLFNNEIYGLTKGQASPTSHLGTRSSTTPDGSTDAPLEPIKVALGAGARFVARTADKWIKEMPDVLKAARSHRGTAFVEILQNCIVYNDQVFAGFTGKEAQDGSFIHVEHGKPLLFGAGSAKGLRVKPGTFKLEVVTVGEGGVTEADILVHDKTDPVLAGLLAAMKGPHFPIAFGVLYDDPAESHEAAVAAHKADQKARTPDVSINALLKRGRTWMVEGPKA
ncbi:MAG: 2-oxoacid:ferredoxin oxidoreductase subunit beta [Caenispirillum bisanense]|nr:2-oxoacid:ferredoxin oxidoreductase subunit beta [Caenispirillum bisanense]MCA1971215.1 2-oxoacid:ferredoxin oxidoreductase subunit beta [Caenispirillum sp.]